MAIVTFTRKYHLRHALLTPTGRVCPHLQSQRDLAECTEAGPALHRSLSSAQAPLDCLTAFTLLHTWCRDTQAEPALYSLFPHEDPWLYKEILYYTECICLCFFLISYFISLIYRIQHENLRRQQK